MKLKDKKIELCQSQYVSDAIGNRKKVLVTVATVWAYFRQLSMKEMYGATTQVQEEVLFQIGYRADLTTNYVVKFRGVEYEILRIDTFEGYKEDLKLYCRAKS
ncbi:MAG: phage head closure protein [Eubacteriales bacterium]|nr:phage head closure protein [Eubacteriales bacterium]